MKPKFKNFLIDVDGVLTDGQFHYNKDGKEYKIFGSDDHDGILLLKPYMNIVAMSGDRKGFEITKKRVAEDMKLPLHLVSTIERIQWIKDNFNSKETVYMGDGIFDAMVFANVGYAIAPANAFPLIKKHADYVTKARGGEGAVAEACWHLLKKFYKEPDILKLKIAGGEWGNKK